MSPNHISVCVITYKRPELLAKLLDKIQTQKTLDLFAYSVVVVDNDEKQSAKNIVQFIQKESSIEIAYYVETRQGISHARNMSVEKAKGNFIAFIDDDEIPAEDWLLNLFNTCVEFDADGVVGVVLPNFEKLPPDWLRKGKVNFWRTRKTGTILTTGITGNAFVKKSVAESERPFFNPDFGLSGGSDSLFFEKLISKGYVFVGCGEAIVYEFVPGWQTDISYLLKRYFLQGSNLMRRLRVHESIACQLKWFLKSVIGILAYSVLLPIFLLFAWHLFMKYLLKISFFGGVFLEFIHISPKYNRRSSTYIRN